MPHFDVQLERPDLGPWRGGNTGIEGFWRLTSATPGPQALITCLVHGNEIAGAIALAQLLSEGFRPSRGSLTLGFCNLAAFDLFDPENPTASRFIDEDMNRLWDKPTLASSRRSRELDRARIIAPEAARADALLDLHSMLWPSDPLILCGPTPRGMAMAQRIGTPGLIVADHGHLAGRRLIDFEPFCEAHTTRCANLIEAGQHWQTQTVVQMQASITAFLTELGMISEKPEKTARGTAKIHPRIARVDTVITAETSSFAFQHPYRGGDIIAKAGTLIATDGAREIRTQYDQCMLVMPSLKPSRGHTAVRLARLEG